jgi:hypothetical protein
MSSIYEEARTRGIQETESVALEAKYAPVVKKARPVNQAQDEDAEITARYQRVFDREREADARAVALRLSAKAAAEMSPDQAAQAAVLARKRETPPEAVLRNLLDVQKQDRTERFVQDAELSPTVARQLGESPMLAAQAADDVAQLAEVAGAMGEARRADAERRRTTRTWGEVATDSALSFAQGAMRVTQLPGVLYGVATSNQDNAYNRFFQEGIDSAQDLKSNKVKAAQKALDANIAAAEGWREKLGVAFARGIDYAVNEGDFTVLADALLNQTPGLVLGGAAGTVLKNAAPAATGALAVQALSRNSTALAHAAVVASKVSRSAATVGAVGAGAVQQAQDVTTGTFQRIKAIPVEQFSRLSEYQALIDRGITPEEARTRVASDMATRAGLMALPLSVAAQALPGGSSIETGLLRLFSVKGAGQLGERALLRPVQEAGSEGLEEAAGAVAQGLQVGQVSAVDLAEEAATAGGQGAGLGFVMGGGFALTETGFRVATEYLSQAGAQAAKDIQRVSEARKQTEQIENIVKAAAATKLAQRNPAALAGFIQQATEDIGNAPKSVFLDADELNQEIKSRTVEEVQAAFPSLAKQIAENTPGGTVEIPIGEFAAGVSALGADKLIQLARAAPDSFNTIESNETARVLTEFLQSGAQIEEGLQAAEAREQEVSGVKEIVREQLAAAGRFPATVNTVYSTLIGEAYSALAARSGQTPQTLYNSYPLKVESVSESGEVAFNQDAELEALYREIQPEFDIPAEMQAKLKEVNGVPEIEGRKIRLTDAKPTERFEVFLSEGEQLYTFNITSPEGDTLGEVDLTFRNGKPTGLYDIEVAESERRKGVGADVIETLLTVAEGPFEISNIVPAARSFWASVGVGEQNVEAGAAYSGTLDWNQFAQSASAARRSIPRRTNGTDRSQTQSLAGIAVEERELTDEERAIFDGFGQARNSASRRLEDLGQKNGVRGRFNPNTFTIKLLEQADLSTFLHESGHMFLEMLFGMASSPNMDEGIKKDAAIVLKWFGFKGPDALAQWNALSLDEKRPYHERWAESFELYLFRGQAPSVALQPAFAKFRAWLKQVYLSLRDFMRSHDTQLTDEVTGVFDRLLATDEQIEEAERLAGYAAVYKDAESAGLSPEEWARYQEMNTRASDNSAAVLQARSLRDLKWTLNAQSKELKKLQREVEGIRKAVRAEVKAEVDVMPVHALRADIARKATPRIYRPALERMFGSEEQVSWRGIPDNLLTNNSENSLPPEVLSEMYGFESVHDMVQQLVFTAPRDEDIEALTEQKLLERYGDLTTPQGVAQAAQEAVHNEARARFTATELAMLQADLNKTAPSATNPKRYVNILVTAAKGYAERLIAARRADQLSPTVFWSAEARAHKRADKALIGKDKEAALVAKRDAILNHYAGRYAVEARKEVERKVDFLKSFDKKEKRASIPAEYLEQIDGLLERFDLRASTTKRDIKRKATLLAWVKQQEDLGLPSEIDSALLDEAYRVSYKTLTVEEIRGLYDTVKSIDYLGRLKNKLLTAKDEREFKAVTEQLTAAALASTTKRRKVRENAVTAFEKTADAGREWLAEHRKLASYLRQLDGFEDGGIWWQTLGRTMNEAADKATARLKTAAVDLQTIFKALDGKLSSRVEIPEIGKALTLETRLSFALNYGNSGNRQRLLDGHQYTEEQMRAILSTLTVNQWRFVESVWAHINSYWPDIRDKQERVTGVAPEKVEAEPFTIRLSDGTVFTSNGGYYPIKADSTTSIRAAASEPAEILQQMSQGKFVAATTRRGHTKERAEKSSAVLRKDIGVIFEHISQVVHDLSWHEWLVDANRIIRDTSVDKALRATIGPEGQKQFAKTLEDIAIGQLAAQSAFERGIGHLRKGTSIVGMAWNLTTAALQVSGFSQSVVRVGAPWVARGVGQMLGGAVRMEGVVADIHSRSEFMRHRADTFTREVNEIRASIYTPKAAALQSTYFYLIAKMQMMVDVPTWLGAHAKAIASGADEAKAVALADQAVRDSQGGGGISDLAQVQRGSQFKQLFTNFYSYFNVTFNLTAERYNETDFTDPIAVGRFMVDMLLLYSVPVAYSVLLKIILIGGEDDEEKIAVKLAREQVSYLLGTVVGLRELSSVAAGFAGYSGPAGTRFFSDAAKTVKEVSQGEVDKALVKAANSAAGAVFHYPAGQMNRTMEGIIALQEGETQNPAVLITGPQKEKP